MHAAHDALSVQHDPVALQPDSGTATMLGWSRSLTGILVILALLPIGCIPLPEIRPLPASLPKTTAASGKTVVLYRITAHTGPETVTRPPYRVELTNADGNVVDSIHMFSPSQELSDEGWAYVLVEPGQYRLAATFRFFGYPSRDFELNVPSEETIVYAGSLSINCRRESFLLFTLTTDCSRIVVSNESKAAEVIADSLPMSTRLLHDFRRP